MSDIKQLNGYIDAIEGYNEGLLIHSYNFGEIREYILEKNKIYVLPYNLLISEKQFEDKKIKLTIKECKRKV
ncbi:MAG: hypothetical protein ABIJ18_05190 [archaeon]